LKVIFQLLFLALIMSDGFMGVWAFGHGEVSADMVWLMIGWTKAGFIPSRPRGQELLKCNLGAAGTANPDPWRNDDFAHFDHLY
jgi:hypothetical protein